MTSQHIPTTLEPKDKVQRSESLDYNSSASPLSLSQKKFEIGVLFTFVFSILLTFAL